MPKKHPEDIDFPVSEVFRIFYSETQKPQKLITKSRVVGTYMAGPIELYRIEGPLNDQVMWAVEENARRLGLTPLKPPPASTKK